MAASRKIKILILVFVLAALAALLFFGKWRTKDDKHVVPASVDGVEKKTTVMPKKPTGPLIAPPPPPENR